MFKVGRALALFLCLALMALFLFSFPPWPPFAVQLGNLGGLSDDIAFGLALSRPCSGRARNGGRRSYLHMGRSGFFHGGRSIRS
jgi:hypothetical protein